MPNAARRVLFTGLSRAQVLRYQKMMTRLKYGFETEADPDAAVNRLRNERFDAVVTSYPLKPGALGSLVAIMRARDSINLAGGLVVLAERDRLRAAAGLVGRGVNKALSVEEDPAVLGVVLQRLVENSQPMAERLPLCHEVLAEADGGSTTWRTENLSGGGMLIASDDPPPVGTRFKFTLAMPDGPIKGEAKVVRHTLPGRETAAGFGVRFCSFERTGLTHLLAYLRATRQSGQGAGRDA